ncbi:L,D-transpeptidase family protein [Candidatus Woesearchaeota archaeon]|nr:L,D-transpeptidase family protein [Candidatus Woesearchaeota archaeon]
MGSIVKQGLTALVAFSLGVATGPYLIKPSTSSRISSTAERVSTEITDFVLDKTTGACAEKTKTYSPTENIYILIDKCDRTLTFHNQEKIKTYKIALGQGDLGDKITSGDGRTPEGKFYIEQIARIDTWGGYWMRLATVPRAVEDYKHENNTNLINEWEKEHGTIDTDKEVRSFNKDHSPDIWFGVGIHGGGNSLDWTNGCIAGDQEMKKGVFEPLLNLRDNGIPSYNGKPIPVYIQR